MGGSASIILSEKEIYEGSILLNLSENQVKELAGDNFHQGLFDSLKDSDGTITKQQFLTMATNEELYLRAQFTNYSKLDDQIDEDSFNAMLIDAKLLDRKFTPAEASSVFSTAKVYGVEKFITYVAFRNIIIPGIAVQKKMTESQIISALGYNQKIQTEIKSQNLKAIDKPSSTDSALSINNDHHNHPAVIAAATYDPNAAGEKEVMLQFMRICSQGEMKLPTFQQLCREAQLIDVPLHSLNSSLTLPSAVTAVTAGRRLSSQFVLNNIQNQMNTSSSLPSTQTLPAQLAQLRSPTRAPPNPHLLTDSDTARIFLEGLAYQQRAQAAGVEADGIKFNVYRTVCLPAIVAKKNMSLSDLFQKLSTVRTEGEDVRLRFSVLQTSTSASSDGPTVEEGLEAASGAVLGTMGRRPSQMKRGKSRRSSSTDGSGGMGVGPSAQATSTTASASLRKSLDLPTDSSGANLNASSGKRASVSGVGYIDTTPTTASNINVSRTGASSRSASRRYSTSTSQSPLEAASPTRRVSLELGKSKKVMSKRSSSSSSKQPDGFFLPDDDTLFNIRLLYSKYSADGLMSVTQYVKLMRDAQILTKVYNSVEAELVFIDAKPRPNPTGSTRSSIIAGMPISSDSSTADKITFDVFFTTCLPAAARKRGDPMEVMIMLLLDHYEHQQLTEIAAEESSQLAVQVAGAEEPMRLSSSINPSKPSPNLSSTDGV